MATFSTEPRVRANDIAEAASSKRSPRATGYGDGKAREPCLPTLGESRQAPILSPLMRRRQCNLTGHEERRLPSRDERAAERTCASLALLQTSAMPGRLEQCLICGQVFSPRDRALVDHHVAPGHRPISSDTELDVVKARMEELERRLEGPPFTPAESRDRVLEYRMLEDRLNHLEFVAQSRH